MGRCSSRKILSTCINGTSRLFIIYLGKQVGPRFRQINDKQNSGLVNFVLESCLPFVQICSIYPKNGHKGLKLVQVSKMDWKKWNVNFHWEDSIWKNRTSFSDVPLLPEIFCWNDPKSHIPDIFQPDFPETFCKW